MDWCSATGYRGAGSAVRGRIFRVQLSALLRESPRTHRPVQSIAELVPLLPAELRQNFTFVHTSRSLFRESVSADFPRVIVFSQDATFISAFVGDPSRAGHDVLETMTFDAGRAAFVLRVQLRLGVEPTTTRQRQFQMQELGQIHNLAQLDLVARRVGVARADWSMALEPDSGAFFDGILTGRASDKSSYLKADLIFELLRHLAQKQPEFAPYFVPQASFPALGYPFGNKLQLDRAAASCQLLRRRLR